MKNYSPFCCRLKHLLFIYGIALVCFSCKSNTPAASADEATSVTETPVQVASVDEGVMTNYIELNATATFLQKNFVKANTIGYIKTANALIGHYVTKGDLLFTIQTKEAQSIGSSINILDTTFKFSVVNKIKASAHGYVTQLNHQADDYVQDGEQLAVISDRASFAFLMQLPFEMRSFVKRDQDVLLTLPGGIKLNGKVSSFMPAVDTASQTQGIVIKVNTLALIPENLVARARIIKTNNPNTISLPKSAILSDETQTEFWVMKVINPTTAVKITVKKGIESGDKVEILSPKFSAQDKIVISGNYGLADTTKIKIIK